MPASLPPPPTALTVLREALTAYGRYGGWERDRTYASTWMYVWKHRDGRLTVVLELGPAAARWSTIRILQVLDMGLTTVADCKVSSLAHALGILAAYGVIDPQHLHAYRSGHRAGYREGFWNGFQHAEEVEGAPHIE